MSTYHRTFAVANGMHKTQNYAIRYTICAAHINAHTFIVVVNVSRCMHAVYTRQWDANRLPHTHTLCAAARPPLPVPAHCECMQIRQSRANRAQCSAPNMFGMPYAIIILCTVGRRANTKCRSNFLECEKNKRKSICELLWICSNNNNKKKHKNNNN